MPLPVIVDGYLCAYRGELYQAQAFEWTFAVQQPESTAGAVAAAIQDPYTDNINPQMCNTVKVTSVAVTPLDGTGAQVVEPFVTVGGHGDGDLTPETCLVVTLRTGIAGRSNRGRVFLPALKSGDLATGKYAWSTSYLGDVNGAMSSWFNDLDTAGLVLGVLSRQLESFRAVSSLAARSPVGTQRRRLTGGLMF